MRFDFPVEWSVVKFDATRFYQNRVKKCHGTKAVDFLAWTGDALFMIEAKDFRQYRIENKPRIASGDLAREVAQKVRDTIAGLYGAFRWEIEEVQPFYSKLLRKNHRIHVVLLLEEDRPARVANDFKIKRSNLLTILKSQLKFLNVRCSIHNREDLPARFQWSVA